MEKNISLNEGKVRTFALLSLSPHLAEYRPHVVQEVLLHPHGLVHVSQLGQEDVGLPGGRLVQVLNHALDHLRREHMFW